MPHQKAHLTSSFTAKSNSKSSMAKVFSKPSKRQEKHSGSKKNKLRTSRDIYNRLKWDSISLNIDITSVYIGYKDRFLGTCELRFTDFHPTSEEGDIPYHRIYYFRTGGPPLYPFVGQNGEIQVREDNWPPGSVILWDRETRQDMIFNSGELYNFKPTKENSKISKEHARGGASYFSPPDKYTVQPSYQYNHEEASWEARTTPTTEGAGQITGLKLVSFNVLFDIYDPQVVQCEKRWPYLIDFLEDSEADLIALQEVTPSFLSILESQSWVQKSYFLTEISDCGTTIQPYGQILLSKIPPFRVLFSNQLFGKRSVIVSLFLNDRFLHISNVHLKSDHKGGDNSKLRQEMVQAIISTVSQLDGTDSSSDFMIVGDTNFRNAERIVQRPGLEMLDVWDFLMPYPYEERPFTTDVENNGLTKKQSQRNQNERYDRIFIRATNIFQPKSIKIVGKSPIDFRTAPRARYFGQDYEFVGEVEHKLWLSDHYGLECSFWTHDGQTIISTGSGNPLRIEVAVDEVVHTSAVAIIPPLEILNQIQAIRSEFDPAVDRWPPHINLLYGFIPDTGLNFENASENFSSALKTLEPFQCTLSEIEVFHHSRASTVYLTTSDTGELQKLRDLKERLGKEYPFCKTNGNAVFIPHMTIAKFWRNDRVKMDELVEQWKESIKSITFTLDRIHLISRRGGSPFRIKNSVILGQPTEDRPSILNEFLIANQLLPVSSEKEIHRSKILSELKRLCILTMTKLQESNSAESKWSTSVHLTGSTFMNFHDDTSDMDILVCGPTQISHQHFFKAFQLVVETADTELHLNSIVLNSLIPIARLSMHEIEIDLVYCNCPDPLEITDQELALMSETFVGSLDAFRESRKLLEIIPQHYQSVYRTAVRAVKFWAKRRNIYSKTLGFVFSNQVSILIAHIILQNPEKIRSPEQIVVNFFETFSGWKWPRPVQCLNEPLDEAGTARFNKNTPKLMPILSPCYPFQNKSRNVTKSTRTLIQRELQRGNDIFSRIFGDFETKWNDILEHQDFQSCYPEYLCVQVCSLNELDLNIARGILESRIVALIVMLEQEHSVFVQPFTEIFKRSDHVEGVCLDQPKPNHRILLAFLGLDTKSNPRVDFTNSVNSYKEKFKNWTSQLCQSRVNIEIHKLPRNSLTLNSFLAVKQSIVNPGLNKKSIGFVNTETKTQTLSNPDTGTSNPDPEPDLDPQDQTVVRNNVTENKNYNYFIGSLIGLFLIGGALVYKLQRKS